MKHVKSALILILGVLAVLGASAQRLSGQQEVVLTIREGMPMIPLALPDFFLRVRFREAREAAAEIRRVMEADLKTSRIFELLPKAHYSYIRPLGPGDVFFKEWDSIQAKLLMAGEISEADGGVVFEGKLFDIKSERFIFGKRYKAAKSDYRYAAHKMADEIMKLYGEKPIFSSKIVFVSNRDGNNEIYMMDYDGAGQTRITYNKYQDYMPAWSPDQRKIVYTSYKRAAQDLVVISPYEQKNMVLASRGLNNSGAFSPDGKKVAFCSTMDGNSEIYVVDADGSHLRRLTFNSAIDSAPCWSPNGREIAFTSDRLGTGMPQIYIMDSEGGNVRKVSFGGNYHDSPAWSPDGERIAFVSRVENAFDLYILNLRTNRISKVTETRAHNETPSWSPDGRHLVFSSDISGTIQIYSVDYDGANLRQLTTSGQNKLPSWTN